MENQKNRSRSASVKEIGDWVEVAKGESDRFIGYETYEIKSKLIRYRRVKEKKNSRIEVVIDPTPFYPEGGGQVGDVGKIQFGDELINVVKTFKENGLIIHNLSIEPKLWTKEIIAKIDIENRNRTSQNHSSTHLIHFALRKILGSHVEQRGSLVHSGGFRFDFSHFEKISNSDLQKIENLVRSNIYKGINTKIHQQIPIESAKEMGAMALFGEKYGDVVRVVQFDESIELCGGTHVQNTSEISTFLIKSESGIASGIRRIEALSGESAIEYLLEKSNKLDRILNEVSQGDPIMKIKSLKAEVLQLEKKLTILNRKEVSNLKQEFLSAAKQYGNTRVITKIVDLESAYIKDLVFQLKENNSSIVILLISVKNDKVQMHLGVSDDSISIIDAGKWVKELSKYIKGGGGGQPSYASSGGKDPEGVNDLLDKFYKKIEKCAS
jgi:alanyl-tRNA synthetase